jgi:hypothetical protein
MHTSALLKAMVGLDLKLVLRKGYVNMNTYTSLKARPAEFWNRVISKFVFMSYPRGVSLTTFSITGMEQLLMPDSGTCCHVSRKLPTVTQTFVLHIKI